MAYCYGCGVPIQEYMPDAHRDHSPGTDCPWKDLIALAMWFIYHDKDIWKAANEAFNLHGVSSQDSFQDWCKAHESRAKFCNALHLFAWFCKRQGLS